MAKKFRWIANDNVIDISDNGYLVCSQARKQFYMKSMSKRLETFLLPALENAKQEILKKRRQNHLGL